MTIAAKLVVAEAIRAVRRAHRERVRRLERELSGYSSASDRADLLATFDRYPDHETALMRGILERQADRAHRR